MMLRAFFLTASLFALATSCNYTDGQCYARGQGGLASGAGGQPVVVGGPGGLGDIPGAPQGADEPTPPDCNIATQSPCYEKCLEDYEAAATKCGTVPEEAPRKTCQEVAYAGYKSCRDGCERTANQDCDEKYQDCVDNGPKACLKKEAGKTLCNRCWERCKAGDSPSSKCRSCRF